MKVYIIKHRGADWWGNYRHSQEIEFLDRGKIYAGRYFFRLKDAKKYLKFEEDADYYEIVPFEHSIRKPKKETTK